MVSQKEKHKNLFPPNTSSNFQEKTNYFSYKSIPSSNRSSSFISPTQDVSSLSKNNLSVDFDHWFQQIEFQGLYLNIQGKVLNINPAFTELTGYTLKNVRGKFLTEFLIPYDFRFLYKSGRKSLKMEIVSKQGERKKVLLTRTVLTDKSGKKTGEMILFIDLTTFQKAQNDLIKSTEEIKEKNESELNFYSKMSHEIRSQLTPILNMIEMMPDGNFSSEQKKYFDGLKFSSEILMNVLNDFLNFSKLKAGKHINLNLGRVNLKEFLTKIALSVQNRLKDSPVDFKFEFDERIQNLVLTDKTKISQILLNFLNNSIKFTSSGLITLKVTLIQSQNGLSYIEFSVSDTGIGIKKSRIQKIFEEYGQAEENTSESFGGTGLGLPIVRQLADLLNGTISVKSKFAEGSTFSVLLPLKELEESHTEVPDFNNAEEYFDPKNSMILLVEDNPMIMKMTVRFFQKWGVNYEAVESGKKALILASKKKYDLILTDFNLPELSGIELTRRIRDNYHNCNYSTPILGFSASVDQKKLDQAISFGMREIIHKPIGPVGLKRILTEYLKKSVNKNPLNITQSN